MDKSYNTINLTYENQLIKKKFFKELSDVYDSNMLMIGKPIDDLETELASYMGTKLCSLTGSGTMAIEVAVRALGIGQGDEIIVPANTFFASATSAANAGAKIILADVDPETMNITPETISRVISKKTKAIIGVHLFGNIIDPEPFKEFNIPFIEDASHGFGGSLNAKNVGNLGAISAFSAGPIKGFGGLGHAGFIGYNNEKWKDFIVPFINNGQHERHIAKYLANNYRIDTVNALFMLNKLQVWDNIKKRRQAVQKKYDEMFSDAGILFQKKNPDTNPCLWVYVIRLPETIRDKVQARLEEKSINTLVQYTVTINQLPIWDQMKACDAKVPVSESLIKSILSLPVHGGITEKDAEVIAAKVIETVKELS